MTRNIAIWIAIFVFTLGVGIGFVSSSLSKRGEPKPEVATPLSNMSTGDEHTLWRAFVSNQEGTTSQRDNLLQEAALHRLRTDCSVARKAWQAVLAEHERLDSKSMSLDEEVQYVSRLLLLQDFIEEAITKSDSSIGLNDAIVVYEEVGKEVDICRPRIAEHLHKVMPALKEPAVTATDDEVKQQLETLLEFAAKDDVRHAVVALIGTMPESGGDPVLKDILAIEPSISTLSYDRMRRVNKRANEYYQLLTSDESLPVEPEYKEAAKPALLGRGELLLTELIRLSDMLERVDLAGWRQARKISAPADPQAPEPTDMKTATSIEEFLVVVQREILQSQTLAYNLWALRECNTAETTNGWESRLAAIDPGALSPSVAALHSSVQSRRIESERDPLRRSRAVRVLLNTPKIPLSAF